MTNAEHIYQLPSPRPDQLNDLRCFDAVSNWWWSGAGVKVRSLSGVEVRSLSGVEVRSLSTIENESSTIASEAAEVRSLSGVEVCVTVDEKQALTPLSRRSQQFLTTS